MSLLRTSPTLGDHYKQLLLQIYKLYKHQPQPIVCRIQPALLTCSLQAASPLARITMRPTNLVSPHTDSAQLLK
jgi:hypothetical protein